MDMPEKCEGRRMTIRWEGVEPKRAAVQLIIPRDGKIDKLKELAEDVAQTTQTSEMESRIFACVATFHGSRKNTMYLAGIPACVELDELLKIAKESDILPNDDNTPMRFGAVRPDQTRDAKVELKPSTLFAGPLMGFFKRCILKWPDEKFYFGIVSKGRAGRAVSFKYVLSLACVVALADLTNVLRDRPLCTTQVYRSSAAFDRYVLSRDPREAASIARQLHPGHSPHCRNLFSI